MNRFALQQQLVYDPTRHITLPFLMPVWALPYHISSFIYDYYMSPILITGAQHWLDFAAFCRPWQME